MAAAPSSPRKDRIAALLVLAETIVCRTDDEKGHIAWTGRSKMLEVITLLDSVDRSEQELRLSNPAPSASQVTGGNASGECQISPTIPWMAEEGQAPDALTIVERGQLFSEWSEKRRRLREG